MSPTPPANKTANKINNEIKLKALRDMTEEGLESSYAVESQKSLKALSRLTAWIGKEDETKFMEEIKAGETLKGTKVS